MRYANKFLMVPVDSSKKHLSNIDKKMTKLSKSKIANDKKVKLYNQQLDNFLINSEENIESEPSSSIVVQPSEPRKYKKAKRLLPEIDESSESKVRILSKQKDNGIARHDRPIKNEMYKNYKANPNIKSNYPFHIFSSKQSLLNAPTKTRTISVIPESKKNIRPYNFPVSNKPDLNFSAIQGDSILDMNNVSMSDVRNDDELSDLMNSILLPQKNYIEKK